MAEVLQIRLLGGFDIVYRGVRVGGVDTTRLQVLLAYLLLHRDEPHTRSHLSFLIWPDSTEAQARTNLRKQLHYLRNVLPDAEQFLDVSFKTIQWRADAPYDLDVSRFEDALDRAGGSKRAGDRKTQRLALEEAAGIYRGNLLPDLYEDWVLSEQDRLRLEMSGALESLVELLEDERDYTAAIDWAQRLLRHDPLHEETYRRLMRLYAVVGKRAHALRIYQTCVSILQRELGVEPDQATREAYEYLQELDEPRSPTTGASQGSLTYPLVGRENEWAQLQSAWRATADGRPRMVILSGEAGIGKTRLANELQIWAQRQGKPVARARCYASEGELAYAPLTAWLRSDPLASALQDLDRVWLAEVARLLPDMPVERPEIVPPDHLAQPWQRQRYFEALARVFLDCDQLILILDDIQWCDGETLAWLSYLLHAQDLVPGPVRLLVVATARSEEASDLERLSSALRDLRRSRQLVQIDLARLSQAGVVELAEHVVGEPLDGDLVAELYRETEGNPMFVVETLRESLSSSAAQRITDTVAAEHWSLPQVVREAILARLARLSPHGRELASVAAVIGREFTFDVVFQAHQVSVEQLVDALDELVRCDILREEGPAAYHFSHTKIREVIYAELSTACRRLLHHRVAVSLETLYVDASDPVRDQIATHYERSRLVAVTQGGPGPFSEASAQER